MNRREFVAGLGGATMWPVAARAQQAIRRLGVMMTIAESDAEALSWPEGDKTARRRV